MRACMSVCGHCIHRLAFQLHGECAEMHGLNAGKLIKGILDILDHTRDQQSQQSS